MGRGFSYLLPAETFRLTQLLEALPQADQWLECASALDLFYIPTRYPDSLPDLTPGRVYRATDSERAMLCAEEIVNGCSAMLTQ